MDQRLAVKAHVAALLAFRPQARLILEGVVDPVDDHLARRPRRQQAGAQAPPSAAAGPPGTARPAPWPDRWCPSPSPPAADAPQSRRRSAALRRLHHRPERLGHVRAATASRSAGAFTFGTSTASTPGWPPNAARSAAPHGVSSPFTRTIRSRAPKSSCAAPRPERSARAAFSSGRHGILQIEDDRIRRQLARLLQRPLLGGGDIQDRTDRTGHDSPPRNILALESTDRHKRQALFRRAAAIFAVAALPGKSGQPGPESQTLHAALSRKVTWLRPDPFESSQSKSAASITCSAEAETCTPAIRHRHPNRDRDPQPDARGQPDRTFLDRLAQPFGDDPRERAGIPVSGNATMNSSPPIRARRSLARRFAVRKMARYFYQNLVTCAVTMLVVHLFEAVKVDNHHGEGIADLHRPRGDRRLGHRITTVVKPGQRVTTDAHGRVRAGSSRVGGTEPRSASAVASVADRSYFREPMATGRRFRSPAFIDRGVGRDPIVALSAPIRSATGLPLGIVDGALDLRAVERTVTPLRRPRHRHGRGERRPRARRRQRRSPRSSPARGGEGHPVGAVHADPWSAAATPRAAGTAASWPRCRRCSRSGGPSMHRCRRAASRSPSPGSTS